MKVVYTNETDTGGKRYQYAFAFDKDEKELLCKILGQYLPKFEKAITKIENHPKNEGQVTFKEKIKEQRLAENFVLEFLSELK